MFKYFKNGTEITSAEYSAIIIDEADWEGMPMSMGKRVVTENRQYARESGSYDFTLHTGAIVRVVYTKRK